jgi:hypothetical protein
LRNGFSVTMTGSVLRFWLQMPAWLSSSNTLAALRHLSYRVV